MTPSPTPNLSPSPGTSATSGRISVDHHVLARIQGPGLGASYLPVDAPVIEASQLQTVRVLFRLQNTGTDPITAVPQLEYRPDGVDGYVVVPEKSQPGVAFSMAREWVPSPGVGGGTIQGPLSEDIAVGDLRIGIQSAGLAVVGHHTMSANPDRSITLPPGSYTEQEFTVRLTMDAQYLTGYQLRVTDGGAELAGSVISTIRLGSRPALRLSPGQRQGVTVDGPKPMSETGVVYPLLSAPQGAAGMTAVTAVDAVSPPSATRYPLDSGSLSPATVASSVTIAVTTSGTGGPHEMAAGQCGACHRGHAAKAPGLLAKSEQSTLCFSCHDGSGGAKDVKSQYNLATPVNNPAEREYYSHDASAPKALELDEFRGKLNRGSACADCHNSHRANATDSAPQTDGWEASGRLDGVSGVSVVNGGAGEAPTYTLLSGLDTNLDPANKVTREYQLCFKCHSGFTTLTSNSGLQPSQYALDKGVEFNPANPSTHPVEAPGTNQTPMMAASLAGTSPNKLWEFTPSSTIRCLNCHASDTTPAPAAGGALQPHKSSNRGILLRNYRDRVLKPRSPDVDAAYSAGDFALCYVCHGEQSFSSQTSEATNFAPHGRHLTGLEGIGAGGTAIDIPGAGQGNAICAECHFRLHSTTNKSGTQTIPGSRLVNFAPNVEPSSGTLSWSPDATPGGGSCTLTCHGYSHEATRY